MGMYMTGIDPHIDDGLSKYDNKSIEKTEKKYKLITIDELIEEKLEQVIADLNELARKTFNEGRVYFQYSIPKVMWDKKEIMDIIADCMDESGWTFDKIDNWANNEAQKKIITFRFYQEADLSFWSKLKSNNEKNKNK